MIDHKETAQLAIDRAEFRKILNKLDSEAKFEMFALLSIIRYQTPKREPPVVASHVFQRKAG